MNLDEWAREIHEIAVEHGWWDEERSFGEVVALCHSELSEALEADRRGEAMVEERDGKPEGVAVEMADCLIRILDWFGRVGIDPEIVVKEKVKYDRWRPYRHGKRY